MTARLRMPGRFDVPIRFIGRFSVKDLLRVGLPITVLGGLSYAPPYRLGAIVGGVALGALLGIVLLGWRPYNRHLDAHLYHLGRWLVERRALDGSDIAAQAATRVITSEGVAVGVIEVDPVNLEMKTEDEQLAFHAVYNELLDTATYPLTVHSRQERLTLDPYIDSLEPDAAGSSSLFDAYLDFCRGLEDGTLATTRHYIVLRVDRDGLHWAQTQLTHHLDELPVDTTPLVEWLSLEPDQAEPESLVNELDSRCREVLDAVNAAELHAERVRGSDLHQLAREFDTARPNGGWNWTTRPFNDSIGEYSRTIYVTEFPSTMDLAWPADLLQCNGLVDVTQVVTPRSAATTTRTLQRLSEKLNAEIDSFLRQGYYGTNKLEGLLADIEWLLDLLADRQAQPVDYAAYITVHSADRDDCLQTFTQVCNRLETLQIAYREPVFRTDQALRSGSPLHADGLTETMLQPGSSAATGFPFATQDTDQDGGVLFGVDTSDESPILLDRFAWSSHSMARMGMVGSGKSFAAKLELLRAALAYPDLRIIIVDPKQEYAPLVRRLDGTTHTLEPGATYSFDTRVQSFEVPERGQKTNVALLVDLVEQLYAATAQNRTKTLVVIDEARILMNDDAGKQVLNQFVLEARDTNTAITLISQNASHFTYCREGREILDNMPGTIFMKHDRVPDDVVDYFRLSQRERLELYRLKTGTDSRYSEALVRVSGRLDTKIRIEPTVEEYALIEAGGRL